jgi:hypothetical protein
MHPASVLPASLLAPGCPGIFSSASCVVISSTLLMIIDSDLFFWSDTWLLPSYLCFLFGNVAGDKEKRKRRKERRLLVLGINFLVSFYAFL